MSTRTSCRFHSSCLLVSLVAHACVGNDGASRPNNAGGNASVVGVDSTVAFGGSSEAAMTMDTGGATNVGGSNVDSGTDIGGQLNSGGAASTSGATNVGGMVTDGGTTASDTTSSTGGTTATQVDYVGNWTGIWSTDGQYGLSFTITDSGTVKGFVLTDSTTTCGSSGNVEALYSGSPTLGSDGTFALTVTGCDANVHCFTDHVTAQLSSDGSAQGTLRRYGSCSLTCTSVSSGGTDKPWRAARDCSQRPTKGASATRFCDESGNSHTELAGTGGSSGSGLSCSVYPSSTGGRGAGGTSSSVAAGGALAQTGGSAPATSGGNTSTSTIPVNDLGEPCVAEFCTSSSDWCFYDYVTTCDSLWCVGSGDGAYCSKSCSSDDDCTGSGIPMKCLTSCNLTPVNPVGHCWDESSFASITDSCR